MWDDDDDEKIGVNMKNIMNGGVMDMSVLQNKKLSYDIYFFIEK